MILPNPKEAIHKSWLYRLLSAIYDNQILADSLYFKGGTCAAMLGYLRGRNVSFAYLKIK